MGAIRAVLSAFGIQNDSADLPGEGERDSHQGDSASGNKSGSMGGSESDHLHKVDDGGVGIGHGTGGSDDASGAEGQSVPKADKGKGKASDCGGGGGDGDIRGGSCEDKPLSDKEYLDWTKARDRFMAGSVGSTPAAGNPTNPHVAHGSYTPVTSVDDGKPEEEHVTEANKGTGRASGCDSNGSGVSGSDKGDSGGGRGSRGVFVRVSLVRMVLQIWLAALPLGAILRTPMLLLALIPLLVVRVMERVIMRVTVMVVGAVIRVSFFRMKIISSPPQWRIVLLRVRLKMLPLTTIFWTPMLLPALILLLVVQVMRRRNLSPKWALVGAMVVVVVVVVVAAVVVVVAVGIPVVEVAVMAMVRLLLRSRIPG